MSTEINTYEVLEIHNVNAATMDMTEKIVEYLQQFNHMESLESLRITKLSLTVDGETVLLEDAEEGEWGNTYVVTQNDNGSSTFGQRQVERTIWTEDSPLMQLIYRITEGKQISLQSSFTIMKLFGSQYGYSFFYDYFENVADKENLANYVTYKCLEYYDCDPAVVSFRFEKISGEMLCEYPKETDDLIKIRDIPQWFSYNFNCEIFGDDPIEENERFELIQKIQEWYSMFADGSEFNDDDESCFYISLAVTLSFEQIPIFQEYLQYFYDFAFAHKAEFTLEADFTPDSEFEFARLMFLEKDGKIIPKAMRY